MLSCEYWEMSKNNYFKEHLCTADSEMTVGIDSSGLSGESLSKPSLLSNITKIPVAFRPQPF